MTTQVSIKYTVLKGDTVHSISQNVLGSTDYWIDIVELNDLDYPFILDERTPSFTGNIKIPGDELLIPVRSGENVVRYVNAEDEVFGTDILLSTEDYIGSYNRPGGFISDGKGDIATVTGEQCLLQDLVHHLLTPKGSLMVHPNYGSDFLQYIGKKNTPDNMHRASVELERTFLSDPRVTDVTNTSIVSYNDTIEISCLIETIIGEIEWRYTL